MMLNEQLIIVSHTYLTINSVKLTRKVLNPVMNVYYIYKLFTVFYG
jgi:hypothetical protein